MSQPTKTDFHNKYEAKGAQQVSLQEYLSRQEKAKKSQFKIPPAVKYILAAPFLIIFCFGLFFIPYMIFKAITSTSADTQVTAKSASHSSHK